MERLRINDLLRYAFSGGIALLTIDILYKKPTIGILTTADKLADAAILGVLALLIGTLIYSLYRSAVYPLIYRVLLIVLCIQKKYEFKPEMLIPWRPTKLEIELDTKRWKLRMDEKSVHNNLVEWGSQIHFLWTTSLAIMAASFVGAHLSSNVTKEFDANAYSILSTINYLILVSAAIAHWRHLIYDHELLSRENCA
jgi:hypothetical protein